MPELSSVGRIFKAIMNACRVISATVENYCEIAQGKTNFFGVCVRLTAMGVSS
jgi:hypothetical protein